MGTNMQAHGWILTRAYLTARPAASGNPNFFPHMKFIDNYLIRLAQDRDQWRVLVNTVMNLRAP
jgi:hypothetical protein